MTRVRAAALVACAALALLLMACSSGPSASPSVRPGCHTRAATVHLALTNTQPVPVVRTLPGGCVAVSVPRSPFRGSATEVPVVLPGDRLRLVSDVVLADGSRTAYFTAIRTGTAHGLLDGPGPHPGGRAGVERPGHRGMTGGPEPHHRRGDAPFTGGPAATSLLSQVVHEER